MAGAERILLGRRVTAIEQDTLRRDLIEWPQKVDEWPKNRDEDYATFVQLETPSSRLRDRKNPRSARVSWSCRRWAR